MGDFLFHVDLKM